MHAVRLAWETAPKVPVPRPRSSSVPEVHVGCSGWFYWDWRGDFYPADLPTNRWFPYYARRFQTVELNAPFYSWPTVGAVKGWVRAGRPAVLLSYTVKACELITHIKRFSRTKTLIRDFGHIADLLGPRMGCFLFQLPPSFPLLPGPASIASSHSWTRPGEMWSNFGIEAGGMSGSSPPSVPPGLFSAPAAGRSCRISWSSPPTIFISAFTG